MDWETVHRKNQEWYVGSIKLSDWIKLNSGNDNADMYDSEKYQETKKKAKERDRIRSYNEERIRRADYRNNLK